MGGSIDGWIEKQMVNWIDCVQSNLLDSRFSDLLCDPCIRLAEAEYEQMLREEEVLAERKYKPKVSTILY